MLKKVILMRKDKKSFCRWGFYVIGKIITKRLSKIANSVITITNNETKDMIKTIQELR